MIRRKLDDYRTSNEVSKEIQFEVGRWYRGGDTSEYLCVKRTTYSVSFYKGKYSEKVFVDVNSIDQYLLDYSIRQRHDCTLAISEFTRNDDHCIDSEWWLRNEDGSIKDLTEFKFI